MPAKLFIRDNEEFKGNAILRHKLEHLLEICNTFLKTCIKFWFVCHVSIIQANAVPRVGTWFA